MWGWTADQLTLWLVVTRSLTVRDHSCFAPCHSIVRYMVALTQANEGRVGVEDDAYLSVSNLSFCPPHTSDIGILGIASVVFQSGPLVTSKVLLTFRS